MLFVTNLIARATLDELVDEGRGGSVTEVPGFKLEGVHLALLEKSASKGCEMEPTAIIAAA